MKANGTHHRVPHQEQRNALEFLAGMGQCPVDVAHLVVPTSLTIRAVLALVSFFILSSETEAALIKGEDSNAMLRQSWVEMTVAVNVFGKAMYEDESTFEGCALRRCVRSRVEIRIFGADEPSFGIRRHDGERQPRSRRLYCRRLPHLSMTLITPDFAGALGYVSSDFRGLG